MAFVPDTRKVFNFAIDIAGVNQFEVQTCQLPDVEVDEVKHGDTNYDVKTPGRVKVGDLVLEKVRPALTGDNANWIWLNTAQNMMTGGGALSPAYKRVITVRELGVDGISTINTWTYLACWVKKLSSAKLDRMSSDNIIETVTLSVERVTKT